MKRMFFAAVLLLAGSLIAPGSESPELRSFTLGSWQKILQSHEGRLTLVHFWGVTCGPCKVELPQLGDFMKQHPAVDVVTIDADLVPNSDVAALSMLKQAGLSPAENWMFSDGFAERLRYEIDPGWQGDIPRTILISRDGSMTTIEGATEPAALQEWFSAHVTATK
jgi:thiol-disulfide isomerase/thioredoxin